QSAYDDTQKIHIDEPLDIKKVQEDAAGEIEHEHVPKDMPQSRMEKGIGDQRPWLPHKLQKILGQMEPVGYRIAQQSCRQSVQDKDQDIDSDEFLSYAEPCKLIL